MIEKDTTGAETYLIWEPMSSNSFFLTKSPDGRYLGYNLVSLIYEVKVKEAYNIHPSSSGSLEMEAVS